MNNNTCDNKRHFLICWMSTPEKIGSCLHCFLLNHLFHMMHLDLFGNDLLRLNVSPTWHCIN